jgi:DNA-binding transcriptional ArsR family regulator
MVNLTSPKLDRVFQALADPTRRRILFQVASSTHHVARLARPFAISAPAISRHLKVLERAGIIERVKSGKFHRFKIKSRGIREAQTVLQQLVAFWSQRLDNLEKFLNQEKTKPN